MGFNTWEGNGRVFLFLPENQGQPTFGTLTWVITNLVFWSDKYGFIFLLQVQMPSLNLVFYMLWNILTKQKIKNELRYPYKHHLLLAKLGRWKRIGKINAKQQPHEPWIYWFQQEVLACCLFSINLAPRMKKWFYWMLERVSPSQEHFWLNWTFYGEKIMKIKSSWNY